MLEKQPGGFDAPPPFRQAAATPEASKTRSFKANFVWHTIRLSSAAMTQARKIIEGATYFLTRRVLHRKLLRPDAAMTNFILYSLAIAADWHEIQINAFCAMSTHVHMVVTDPNRNLPHFLRCFHHLVAMGAKRIHNWKGPVWDHARAGVVRLLTSTAITEKITYTLANPVIVGEVSRIHQWLGAKSLVTNIGHGALCILRPKFYFRSNGGKWPEKMYLQIHLPPSMTSAAAFRKNITERIEQVEKTFHKKKPKQSKRSKHRATRISTRNPATINESKYLESSTFAVGEGHKDVFEAECAAMKSFRSSYRNALSQWRSGDRAVTFPRGTWWMCEFHKANIESPLWRTQPNMSHETPHFEQEP